MLKTFVFEGKELPSVSYQTAFKHFRNGGRVIVTTQRGYYIIHPVCKTGFDEQLKALRYFHECPFTYYNIPEERN